jgi:hypothetical protein
VLLEQCVEPGYLPLFFQQQGVDRPELRSGSIGALGFSFHRALEVVQLAVCTSQIARTPIEQCLKLSDTPLLFPQCRANLPEILDRASRPLGLRPTQRIKLDHPLLFLCQRRTDLPELLNYAVRALDFSLDRPFKEHELALRLTEFFCVPFEERVKLCQPPLLLC